MEIVSVEDRDDGEGTDVVDDGESEHEDPQMRGVLRTDEREDADREGGIGRDDGAPGVRFRSGMVDQQKHQCRDDQSPDRRGDGKQRGGWATQLPKGELAPDIESDSEEEQGHESLIDPLPDGQVERAAADSNGRVSVPEPLVAVADVCPDQGGERGSDKGERRKRLVTDTRYGAPEQTLCLLPHRCHLHRPGRIGRNGRPGRERSDVIARDRVLPVE